MLRVALAQVRVHARRFVAVGLAVMLGVAFLSATLMVGGTTKASLGQSIGASYASADLVVSDPDGGWVPAGTMEALAAIPAVDAAYELEHAYTQVDTGSELPVAIVTSTAPPELSTAELTQGTYPSRPDEAAIDEESAQRLGVSTGDTITVAPDPPTGSGGATAAALKVTGVTVRSADPVLSGAVQILASPSVVRGINGDLAGDMAGDMAGDTAIVRNIQLALSPGADSNAVIAAVTAATAGVQTEEGQILVVRTAAEQTDADVATLSGGSDLLTGILLAFAAVAIVVAGLVISNTFSVLVAQRTRELALLRCIGAERRQIRTAVLVEALLVGLTASALGVLLAVGVMAGLVGLARQTDFGYFAVLAVPATAVLTGLLVGVLMTLFAALVPARAATRVAPLAALRPADRAPVRSTRGRVRLLVGSVLLVAGGGLLAFGALAVAIGPAVAGGAVSFLGVVLLAPFYIPATVAGVGRIARPLGVPGRLAAVNAVRNPARTTASSAALMVGVTLVTMMIVGAHTARGTFDRELAENYAVDLEVDGVGGSANGDPSSGVGATPTIDIDVLLGVDGVLSAVELTPVMLTGAADAGFLVYAADPKVMATVLRSQEHSLTDGMVLAPQTWTQAEVTLEGGDGPSTLPVTATDAMFFVPLITTATAERLGGTPPGTLDAYLGNTGGTPGQPSAEGTLAGYLGTNYWLRLDDGLPATAILETQSQLAAATGVAEYQVSGAALERASYNQIIAVMLLIVTALLAVAVLIALIGVANTLSLSVLERRQENSLLRALGLTKVQLRGMLAVEAVLMAGVAALLGTVLGVLYGWLGAQSALGGIATVVPAVPAGQLALVLAVAIAAGLLASVLPARRAARLAPTVGLAAD